MNKLRDCTRWLWKATDGYRGTIAGNACEGIVSVMASLAFIFVCKQLIDIATGQTDGSLTLYIGGLLGCLLLQLLLSALRSRSANRMEIRMRNRLRHKLFVQLMESRLIGNETLHSGDILNRLEEDVSIVTDSLCRTVPTMAVTGLQLTGALLLLAQLDMRLAGTLLFIMPLALLFSKSYVHRMRRLSKEIRTTDSRVQSHLQEFIQNRILIRTLEYTAQATGKLFELQTALLQKVLERTDFSVFSRSMVQLGFMAGYVVAFLWGIFGLQAGSVTFGMMAAFLQLVAQVQRPMVELSRQIPSFIQVSVAVERLAELADLPHEEQGDPIKLQGKAGIRLENIHYTYPAGKRDVLAGFTHDFKPGSLTAVVGETGVGKSTLFRLILALLLPDQGRILFYDTEKEIIASPQTRCNLSYVPQGNTLLSGTIRENLLMGNPDATDAELKRALHTAVADFVYTLPNGLETRCEEKGAGISEGQAQRIAIARGLLRPGSILLLDEPTSSLDSETEEILLERLAKEVKDKTLILITHRETLATRCTEVLQLVAKGASSS